MTTRIKTITLICFFSIFIDCRTYTQSLKIEDLDEIASKQYSDLLKCIFMESGADSVAYYSSKFSDNFKNLVKNNPATLDHNFKKLLVSNAFQINTSQDGNFRIYSWDTWTGGTMHFFDKIYQFKDNGKVFTIIPANEEGDAGNFCSKIFTIPIENKTYYFTISNSIYSTKDVSQSISIFNIDNEKLIDTVKLFKTKTKLLNNIDVDFDFFSVADRPERPLELITYDEQQKIIYIPVVNDKGEVTEKNILYQLKDSYFEFIGIEKGKRK